MRRLDGFASTQFSNRVRQFRASCAMIGTCRQIQLARRHPHQTLTIVLQLTKKEIFLLCFLL
jgi:hypothetical protein